MKNLKVFVIMVMLAASLVGCGEKETVVNTGFSPNEKILVENIETETILVENIETETIIK